MLPLGNLLTGSIIRQGQYRTSRSTCAVSGKSVPYIAQYDSGTVAQSTLEFTLGNDPAIDALRVNYPIGGAPPGTKLTLHPGPCG
eukprot:2560394-Rhodomonas_salina.2